MPFSSWATLDSEALGHLNVDTITGVSDGSPVGTWVDLIGGLNATDIAGQETTYKTNIVGGLPVIRLAGTSAMDMGLPAALLAALSSDAYTIMLVGILRSNSAFQMLFGQHDNAGAPGFGIFSDGVIAPWQAAVAACLAPDVGDLVVLTLTANPAYTYPGGGTIKLMRMFCQGMPYGNSDTANSILHADGANGNFIIGRNQGFLGTGAHLDLRHLLFFDHVVDTKKIFQAAVLAHHEAGLIHPAESSDIEYVWFAQGDSLTSRVGTGGTKGVGIGYTDTTAAAQGRKVGQWANFAVGGIDVDSIAANAATEEDALSSELILYNRAVLTMWEWANERTSNADLVLAYAATRRATGNYAKLGICTQTDFDPGFASEAQKDAYNADVTSRYSSEFDFLVDFGSDPTVGVDGSWTLSSGTYWSDQLHLNAAGDNVIKPIYKTALDSLTFGPAYGTPASNGNGTIITIPTSGGVLPLTFSGGATTVNGSIFAETSFAGVHVTGANATISGSDVVCVLAVPIGQDQTLPMIDSTNLHGLQDVNGTAFPAFTSLTVTNSSTLVAATPAGFTLTPFSNRVVVSWTADSDCNTNVATKIYRSTDDVTFTLRTTINNSATNIFNDTTAVNGTQYWYYATREYFGSSDVSDPTSTLTTQPPSGVPVFTSISISPSKATLADTDVQTFVVTGIDQFGHALSSQPSFTGNIDVGGGSLTGTDYTSDGNKAVVSFSNGTISRSVKINYSNNYFFRSHPRFPFKRIRF